MKNILKKITGLLVIGILFGAFCPISVSAEVFTEKTGAGKADSVYIAGSPDSYPIEYYDTDTKTYKGVIPDMLKVVSEKTGIDFTYISAGRENMQESLCKNNQVELVTAVLAESNEFEGLEKYTVLTVEAEGKTENYCIAFTTIMTEELKAEIKNAFSNISEPQKAGFLLDNAKANAAVSQKRLVIAFSVAAVVFLLMVSIPLFVFIRKKRKAARANRLVDEATGIGNADYYLYVFENLISGQSRNLYSLAYISFDTEAFEKQQSRISLRDAEKYAAARLHGYVASAEYLSHIGAGAFAFLFQAENSKTAENRVSEAVAGVNGSIKEFAADCEVSFRAGFCRLCEHMGADAENALYHAKQGYLYAEANNLPYHIGSKSQIDELKKEQRLSAQVNEALKNGEFKIYMQFITDGKTGDFCGAEVLSRWQNSEYGLLRPHEYIDILSRTGKIVEHDYNVFENACRLLEIWDKAPFDKLFLTCNFTRLSVSKENFAEKLNQIAQNYNFKHSRIVIEITEDSLSVNSRTVSENIRRISAFGFKVAIDDMGAGFSSLADIYDNEIDIVKIEKDFVSACVTERRQRMLCDIISLVHNAGARVICEGVENREQSEMLKNIDCDMMQGFYNSRVLPLSECEKFVLARTVK